MALTSLNNARCISHSTLSIGDVNVLEVAYKSGAKFLGHIENYKKQGSGIFIWPDNSRYEGEFYDNKRNGKGFEKWSDGSEYSGEYLNDMKHGIGCFKWPNGESYDGQFFRDCRHGRGKYSWPDGSHYVGKMYMNKREGYGTFTYGNREVFQGLYNADMRFGPGIYTYLDGRQDVGLWEGDKLIKFCTPIAEAFDFLMHTKFDYDVDEHRVFLKDSLKDCESHTSIRSMLRSRGVNDYIDECIEEGIIMNIFNDNLDPQCLSVNKTAFDEEFFRDYRYSESNSRKQQIGESTEDEATSFNSDNKSDSREDNVSPTDNGSKSIRSKTSSKNQINRSIRSGSLSNDPTHKIRSKLFSKERISKRVRSRSISKDQSNNSIRSQEPSETCVSDTIPSHHDSLNPDASNDKLADKSIESEFVWNETPSLIRMQHHVRKHHAGRHDVNFNIDDLISNRRDLFGGSGLREERAKTMIESTIAGDVKAVEDMLMQGLVHPDVADRSGTTALIMATVTWHTDIIKCLLSYGADINKLSDQGCSAISAGFILYYPATSFRWNIAERYMGTEAEWNLSLEPSQGSDSQNILKDEIDVKINVHEKFPLNQDSNVARNTEKSKRDKQKISRSLSKYSMLHCYY